MPENESLDLLEGLLKSAQNPNQAFKVLIKTWREIAKDTSSNQKRAVRKFFEVACSIEKYDVYVALILMINAEYLDLAKTECAKLAHMVLYELFMELRMSDRDSFTRDTCVCILDGLRTGNFDRGDWKVIKFNPVEQAGSTPTLATRGAIDPNKPLKVTKPVTADALLGGQKVMRAAGGAGGWEPTYLESAAGYPQSAPVYPQSAPGYPQSAPGYPRSTPVYPQSAPVYPQSAPAQQNGLPPRPAPVQPQPTHQWLTGEAGSLVRAHPGPARHPVDTTGVVARHIDPEAQYEMMLQLASSMAGHVNHLYSELSDVKSDTSDNKRKLEEQDAKHKTSVKEMCGRIKENRDESEAAINAVAAKSKAELAQEAAKLRKERKEEDAKLKKEQREEDAKRSKEQADNLARTTQDLQERFAKAQRDSLAETKKAIQAASQTNQGEAKRTNDFMAMIAAHLGIPAPPAPPAAPPSPAPTPPGSPKPPAKRSRKAKQ